MSAFLGILITIIVETALATMIIVRAWQHRPARWFVALVLSLASSSVLNYLRSISSDPSTLTWLNNGFLITMGFISISSLGLLSSLFMPVWWQGKKPIRFIMLPYLFFQALIILDILARLQLFIIADSGMLETSHYVKPGSTILVSMFLLSWIVQVVMLIFAFKRYPQWRNFILLMIGSLIISSTSGLISAATGLHGPLGIFATTFPLLGTLAFAVLRSDLIIPVRAALDQALSTLQDIVIVLDSSNKAIYANQAAHAIGVHIQQTLSDSLIQLGFESSSTTNPTSIRLLRLNDRQYELTKAHVLHNNDIAQQTTLLLARDMTDIYDRTQQLENERTALANNIKQLNTEREERQQLETTVHQLAQPIIPVLHGVLVVPLIGEFDQERRESFMHTLLVNVEQARSRCVLIDVTGVTLLDEADASMLVATVGAIRLLGARCVIIGVRPDLAQSLVALNVPLTNLETSATLQQAVYAELDNFRG